MRCLLAAGPVIDADRRLVGVIDRDWVEFVIGAFDRRRIRVEALWPAQLALPVSDDGWSLAAVQGADLALLEVETGNTAARALYRGEGFTPCGEYRYLTRP